MVIDSGLELRIGPVTTYGDIVERRWTMMAAYSPRDEGWFEALKNLAPAKTMSCSRRHAAVPTL